MCRTHLLPQASASNSRYLTHASHSPSPSSLGLELSKDCAPNDSILTHTFQTHLLLMAVDSPIPPWTLRTRPPRTISIPTDNIRFQVLYLILLPLDCLVSSHFALTYPSPTNPRPPTARSWFQYPSIPTSFLENRQKRVQDEQDKEKWLIKAGGSGIPIRPEVGGFMPAHGPPTTIITGHSRSATKPVAGNRTQRRN
ncbi:hypothetical protein D9611_009208 [Ephemerocybe angulata]|uniref:Uncharacterized protein n=1 Tax=Ephemerocybe angulata TaxID=980116 RepID=A0A8H5FKJ8_9AGAR|nr:hypothetical protein D9611_009208 [Tulosesus angulatus]